MEEGNNCSLRISNNENGLRTSRRMLAFFGGLTKGSDRRQCLWPDGRFVACIFLYPEK
jgi:hypothetical protein